MPFDAINYPDAVNISKSRFDLEEAKEHPFLLIAMYKAINVRQIEKRLASAVATLKSGTTPATPTFSDEDFDRAIAACQRHLDIEDHQQHPFMAVAMYEAMGFRQIEERMEELMVELSKVRKELDEHQRRLDNHEQRLDNHNERIRRLENLSHSH